MSIVDGQKWKMNAFMTWEISTMTPALTPPQKLQKVRISMTESPADNF